VESGRIPSDGRNTRDGECCGCLTSALAYQPDGVLRQGVGRLLTGGRVMLARAVVEADDQRLGMRAPPASSPWGNAAAAAPAAPCSQRGALLRLQRLGRPAGCRRPRWCNTSISTFTALLAGPCWVEPPERSGCLLAAALGWLGWCCWPIRPCWAPASRQRSGGLPLLPLLIGLAGGPVSPPYCFT